MELTLMDQYLNLRVNNLNILDIPNPLSGDDFAELQQQIDPLYKDNAYGIDVYISTCSFVRARLGT